MRKTGKLLYLLVLAALGWSSAAAYAAGMQPLDDATLSDVCGGDGLSFAINLNANIGALTFGNYDSAGNPASIGLNNFAATGTIAGTFDVVSGASGTPDYVNWAFPSIAGADTLQIGYDMLVTANGSSFGTSMMFQNLAFNGTSMQVTAATTGGISFGLDLNLAIGDVLLQPNGRGTTAGQMAFSGVSVSAAGSGGSSPWSIADVNAQPGIFNLVPDANGNSNVQIGIGWPTTPGTAASGALQIDNITFTTPTGNVNLGASSIGSMQIQYLNIRFKS